MEIALCHVLSGDKGTLDARQNGELHKAKHYHPTELDSR